MLRRILIPISKLVLTRTLPSKTYQPTAFHFSTFMALFEKPKRKQQLSPVFKRQTHLKGHLRSKARGGRVSPKLNPNVRQHKQKIKNHQGMLKRIKIVGPRWNRQFKFRSPANYHLKRNKSSNNLKRKSRARYISKADIWRVRKLIPYYKRQALKRMY